MKLTTILLTVLCLQLSVNVYAQKITLNKTDAGLEDILLEINKQTGYSYSVNSAILSKSQKITLNVKNAELESVLDECFKDQPLSYSIKDNTIIIREKIKASDSPARLMSTIYESKDLSIVLDNFPYEWDFDSINPNDVESITILKDDAAASIYGARRGSGVIVITTNKGRSNQKMEIDINSTKSIMERPAL